MPISPILFLLILAGLFMVVTNKYSAKEKKKRCYMAPVIIVYRRTIFIFLLVTLGISVWGIEIIYADSQWRSNMFEPGLVNKTIIVDPGHGGADPGAVVGNTFEKEINLEISKKIEEELDKKGTKVFLTRRENGGLNPHKPMNRAERRVNLNQRKQFGLDKKGNIYVSIHTNSLSDSQVSGIVVFYHSSGQYSQQLAEAVAKRLEEKLNQKVSIRQANYLVIYDNSIPSILIEVGFLTNKYDRTNLTDEEYQRNLAQAVVMGMDDYAGQLGKGSSKQ